MEGFWNGDENHLADRLVIGYDTLTVCGDV